MAHQNFHPHSYQPNRDWIHSDYLQCDIHPAQESFMEMQAQEIECLLCDEMIPHHMIAQHAREQHDLPPQTENQLPQHDDGLTIPTVVQPRPHILAPRQTGDQIPRHDIGATTPTVVQLRNGSPARRNQHICKGVHPKTKQPCNKSFSRVCDLTRHAKNFHEKREEIECSTCGVTFSRADALTRHLRVVHGGEL